MGPINIRYSDFLKLIEADRMDKISFSADGTSLIGADIDGVRIKIDSLPSDPDLLTQLSDHQVHDHPSS